MHFLKEAVSAGAPAYLDGLMHEQFHADGASKPMKYDWAKSSPIGRKWKPAPAELWLVTKDRHYDFDFRAAFGGFMVSRTLWDALNADSNAWHASGVHAVDAKGQPVSSKSYVFVQPDLKASVPDPIQKDSSVFQVGDLGFIDEISQLRFSATAADRDVFVCLTEPVLWPILFVSNKVATALAMHEWSGVEVSPVEQFSRSVRF